MQSVICFLIVSILVNSVAFAQSADKEIDAAQLAAIIQNTRRNSLKMTFLFFRVYQHSYKTTAESPGRDKKREAAYEQYCLNDKSFCSTLLIERDGKPLAASKIQKAREKAAQELTKKDSSEPLQTPGSGIYFPPTLIDSTVYLQYCKIASAMEKTVDDKALIMLHLNGCRIDDLPADKSRYIVYLPKTEADISIDKQDENVVEMRVYVLKDFVSEQQNRARPAITMENTKLPNGDWMFKRVYHEGIGNEMILPGIKNNVQYDFFDFKKLSVTVTEAKDN